PISAAYAQELPVPASQAPQVPADEVDELPDEYFEESSAFFDQCVADYNLSQYYNCECLSLALLDERIKQGPSVPTSTLRVNIQNQCRDSINAAGPLYQSCLAKANRFQPGTDPEKYCECVANSYVRTMDRLAPRISSQTMVALKSRAYVECNSTNRR
ncbi:MAG: hypothetical protein AAF204_00870, partial [Pseudomonadota bacterium]